MAYRKINFKSRKVKKKCIRCSKDFEVYPYRKDSALYCGLKCPERQAKKPCGWCGKILFLKPSHVKQRKFCSMLCSGMFRRSLHPAEIERKCKQCKITKPMQKFGVSRSAVNGRLPRCRPCSATRSTALHNVNRARRMKSVAKPRHRPIVTGAEGYFTRDEWLSLCEQFGNRCANCRRERKLTVDHIVPLILDGSNYIHNLQPLCVSCNSSKGIKIIRYARPKGQLAFL